MKMVKDFARTFAYRAIVFFAAALIALLGNFAMPEMPRVAADEYTDEIIRSIDSFCQENPVPSGDATDSKGYVLAEYCIPPVNGISFGIAQVGYVDLDFDEYTGAITAYGDLSFSMTGTTLVDGYFTRKTPLTDVSAIDCAQIWTNDVVKCSVIGGFVYFQIPMKAGDVFNNFVPAKASTYKELTLPTYLKIEMSISLSTAINYKEGVRYLNNFFAPSPAAPVISSPDAALKADSLISISEATPGATVRYAFDSQALDCYLNGTNYSTPLSGETVADRTLKAIACLSEFGISQESASVHFPALLPPDDIPPPPVIPSENPPAAIVAPTPSENLAQTGSPILPAILLLLTILTAQAFIPKTRQGFENTTE